MLPLLPTHHFAVHRNVASGVWAVGDDGVVYEAQLSNAETGEYHGYPMTTATASPASSARSGKGAEHDASSVDRVAPAARRRSRRIARIAGRRSDPE